ncbi:MAG: hypothetical protein AAGD86_07300, partial [Pseudomonadota bacterium]
RGRGPLTLAFALPAGNRARAQRLEYRIKRLSKAQKERLVAGDRAVLERLLNPRPRAPATVP